MILILLITSGFVYGQDYSSEKSIKKINRTYTKKLDLSSKQSQEFVQILLKYNPQLKDAEGDKNLFNKILKNLDLEVYKLLSLPNFEKYKSTKVIIEPYKRYKL